MIERRVMVARPSSRLTAFVTSADTLAKGRRSPPSDLVPGRVPSSIRSHAANAPGAAGDDDDAVFEAEFA